MTSKPPMVRYCPGLDVQDRRWRCWRTKWPGASAGPWVGVSNCPEPAYLVGDVRPMGSPRATRLPRVLPPDQLTGSS